MRFKRWGWRGQARLMEIPWHSSGYRGMQQWREWPCVQLSRFHAHKQHRYLLSVVTHIQVDGNMAKVFSYSVPSTCRWATPRMFKKVRSNKWRVPQNLYVCLPEGEVQFGRPRECSLLLLPGLITHHNWAWGQNLGFLWLLNDRGQTDGGTCLVYFCVILSFSLTSGEGCVSLIPW